MNEYFDILFSVCRAEESSLYARYKQLRDLLERLCRELMRNESLQMTDLSARISYVAAAFNLSVAEQNRLHTFRLTSNAILNDRKEPGTEELFRDTKTLAFFVKKVSGEEIPYELYRLLPRADATYVVRKPEYVNVQRMRVCFQYADEKYLYVSPVDEVTDDFLRVRYNLPEVNEEFNDTCKRLWQYAQVNLLDVTRDEEGILSPAFIVLEPDYLIDISSLAECYKEYGHHPANYQFNKLHLIENTRPLLLGNIANLFLDEWINSTGEPDYQTCMQKAFRRYPIELAACTDLYDKDKEREFFEDCRKHFRHIKQTLHETFNLPGYKLDKTDAVLEPSYICEPLGLHGRLDYMQRDMNSFIEMKSGKADEYTLHNKIEPKENNRVQMLLYQAVLQYSMGKDHRDVNAYLLYTRYPLLYPARSSWAMVRRIINLRNCIVSDEYAIQLHNSIDFTNRKLKEINPDTLNQKRLNTRFWNQYLCPSITGFSDKLQSLNHYEKSYFISLFNFIAKEQYTSKSGDIDYEGKTGASSLWLSTLAEKKEAGEILYNLRIVENNASDEHKPFILFTVETEAYDQTTVTLPNFRHGDAVVLYQRNKETDNVTNKQVFKGTIEKITACTVKIRLRSTQQNRYVLPRESYYAIEHDTMDTTFRKMYQGLATFLCANKERRDLILSCREPQFDETYLAQIKRASNDLDRIILKAQAAKDYFLLVGPPGTGKTSQAIRRMVETFHEQEDTRILLLAYTNRAVDEICKTLRNIKTAVDFIRIGSELSCEPEYREHLPENILADCTRRVDAKNRINRCRIFVSTVAAITGKPEIFRLNNFDVAIIDEATQILEPQLLGLLCACDHSGTNAIGKFILVGDHKQLPAVVLQNSTQTGVADESLRSLGIFNWKDSLFERLFRSLKPDIACYASDSLTRQGRMHPEVAYFSNKYFYNNKLETLGLPHQLDDSILFPEEFFKYPYICLNKRTVYFYSTAENNNLSHKINYLEAEIAVQLSLMVYNRLKKDFCPTKTLGIITPYRNQIALIKKKIAGLNIPMLNDIAVDTVERFQGSERDIIIYSFCINHRYQLKNLSNVIEEDSILIDRKLNVVLTRARKQLFLTGCYDLLCTNPIYFKLLKLTE